MAARAHEQSQFEKGRDINVLDANVALFQGSREVSLTEANDRFPPPVETATATAGGATGKAPGAEGDRAAPSGVETPAPDTTANVVPARRLAERLDHALDQIKRIMANDGLGGRS